MVRRTMTDDMTVARREPPDPSLPARLRAFHERLPLAGDPRNAVLALPDDRLLYLVAVLRDTPPPAPAMSPEAWQGFLDLLKPHGVSPLMAYRLRAWPEDCRPPKDVTAWLDRAVLAAAARAMRACRQIQAVVDALKADRAVESPTIVRCGSAPQLTRSVQTKRTALTKGWCHSRQDRKRSLQRHGPTQVAHPSPAAPQAVELGHGDAGILDKGPGCPLRDRVVVRHDKDVFATAQDDMAPSLPCHGETELPKDRDHLFAAGGWETVGGHTAISTRILPDRSAADRFAISPATSR